ncbi:MAG: hypothetical protein AAFR54_21460, partial [Planctomycetota bacterium]
MDGAPTDPVTEARTDPAAEADTASRADTAPRARLRAFRGIDASDPWIGSRNSLRPRDADRFEGDAPLARLARALCARSALPVKELFEAAEVFALARKRVRAPVVADLCCGHGLGGILFGLMERTVEHVLLVDRVRPASADVLLDAADEVAPWVRPKVVCRTRGRPGRRLPPAPRRARAAPRATRPSAAPTARPR